MSIFQLDIGGHCFVGETGVSKKPTTYCK